jgi:hypothetical protein
MNYKIWHDLNIVIVFLHIRHKFGGIFNTAIIAAAKPAFLFPFGYQLSQDIHTISKIPSRIACQYDFLSNAIFKRQ